MAIFSSLHRRDPLLHKVQSVSYDFLRNMGERGCMNFFPASAIVVRNSIILVDFIELRRQQGMPLAEAVIDAGAIRFRPMRLTALAVVAGSAVLILDPIFQGMALSLVGGEVAATALSRVVVPILYYMSERRLDTAQPQAITERSGLCGLNGSTLSTHIDTSHTPSVENDVTKPE